MTCSNRKAVPKRTKDENVKTRNKEYYNNNKDKLLIQKKNHNNNREETLQYFERRRHDYAFRIKQQVKRNIPSSMKPRAKGRLFKRSLS
jgi:hypothetical protein